MAPPRILLISNSTIHGRGYLDHAEAQIREFLDSARTILFFPFALFDRDAYAAKAAERLGPMGYAVESAHAVADPGAAIAKTDAIFVGGGNTFRLLKALQDLDLIEPIRRRVREGGLYIGSSAGSNVAGKTIKTTKDMPIVQPRSFDAIGLVPFQISPHFQDPDPNSTHMGETQEERILQFLEENDTPVLGLREGAWVVAAAGSVVLKGANGARIFRRGHDPVEAKTGDEISALVGAPDAA
ncbi:MAG TPA: dipeptidase PepE [Chthoniobacterales bacterium]|jgi:dipeptidase E|nr:dipeptidase PepE [Chthoniobacterales bacterium]